MKIRITNLSGEWCLINTGETFGIKIYLGLVLLKHYCVAVKKLMQYTAWIALSVNPYCSTSSREKACYFNLVSL